MGLMQAASDVYETDNKLPPKKNRFVFVLMNSFMKMRSPGIIMQREGQCAGIVSKPHESQCAGIVSKPHERVSVLA